MIVKSYSIKDLHSFKRLLEQDQTTGFNPTLAICFCDATLDFKTLAVYLTSKNIDVMGATTCGEVHDNMCQEGTFSMLLLEIDKSTYHLELASFDEGEDVAAKNIAQVALEKFDQPALLTYASKVGANGDKIVTAYKEILKPATPIFGGLAGDNFRNIEFTVFHNDNFETNGLVALIFDGTKLRVEGMSYSGWKPLGKTHIVTKADGNVLYEIDNTPALELFIEYFGLKKLNSSAEEEMVSNPGISLKVIDKNKAEKIRAPLYYDREQNALILAGELEIGDKVKFCTLPDMETVTNTVAFFESYAETHPDVDAVIINSCASRKFAFGPLMSKEINDIYEIWKAPTAGLMAMGEIGCLTTESGYSFHNVTCSLVSLTQIN